MEITLDRLDKNQGLIKINLLETDYQPVVTQKIKEFSKKANIKGFRPGKVPLGLVKQMFGKSILLEELNKLLSDKLNTYLRESDLQFLGEPIPQEDGSIDLENQKDFVFKYKIGFASEFELPIDNKFKIDKHLIKVDDKVINETIDNLRKQFGTPSNPEKAEEGDTLYGAMKSADGSINMEISVEFGDLEKAYVKKFTGVKVGDSVEIEPKKLYKDTHKLHHQLRISHDDFEEMTIKLSFEVKGINRNLPADINQELFDKTFGPDSVKTEAEFREKVKEAISQNYKREEEQFLTYTIREQLVEKTKIELPDTFLKEWLLKTNDKLTPDLLQTEYDSYAKELRWSLIRNKIAKKEGLKAEAQEVIEEAKNLIRAQFGQAGLMGSLEDRLDDFASNYLQGEDGENYMKMYNQVMSNKVYEYVKSQVTIKEKTVTVDEFRKL